MVVTHFVLAGKVVTGATVGVALGGVPVAVVVLVVVVVVVVVTEDGLSVTVTTGLVRVVWISALRARAVLSFSLIWSICSCSSCSSPGRGGATGAGGGATTAGGGATAMGGGAGVLCLAEEEAEEEDDEGRESTRLASDTGPPFSHSLLFGPALGLAGDLPSGLAPPSLASAVAMRASRRRVLRVSRLNWTRLKSLASLAAAVAASLQASLFHLADVPGGGGAGGPGGPGGGGGFCKLQLNRNRETRESADKSIVTLETEVT